MNNNRLGQLGYTLAELVIVILILGIIGLLAVMSIGGGATDAARASALYDTTAKFAKSWSALASSAGQPTSLGGSLTTNVNPMLVASSVHGAIDILRFGKGYVAPAYQPAYDKAGLMPMTDAVQGATGSETISGFPVVISGNGAGGVISSGMGPFVAQFSNVSEKTILNLVQKYGSGVTALAASDTTNTVIQYAAANADGTRTLYIIQQL
jgi:type II secretory pathway pseudopilin PulG